VRRNDRSSAFGTTVQVAPESVFRWLRNTHPAYRGGWSPPLRLEVIATGKLAAAGAVKRRVVGGTPPLLVTGEQYSARTCRLLCCALRSGNQIPLRQRLNVSALRS
jgi:hypothetical protein